MEDLKNNNVANLDEYQMYNRVFDPTTDSFRMKIVDGITLTAETINLPEIKFPEQSPIVIKEQEIKEIQVPVIVKELEIKEIQIPVITKEIEVITIEKPIIIPEIKVIEIEKPIIVKEIQVIEQKIYEMPLIAKICMVVQALALIGILLTKAI